MKKLRPCFITLFLLCAGLWAVPAGAAPVISSFSPTVGCAGVTPIVITGTGFTGVTGVSVGGITASFVVNSGTQITAMAPTGVRV